MIRAGLPKSEESGELQYEVSDRDLLSIVQRELDSSLGWTGTRLAETRRKNLNAYFGNPRGDEREGRSQVRSRDVFEQVEWALPPLMEIFLSGNEVVKFEPRGPEDEQGARQQTDACNHTFQRENGPMVLYTAFKDALVQKNGVVEIYYERTNEVVVETYRDKGIEELAMLDADPDFEIRAATTKMQGADGQWTEVPADAEEAMRAGVPPEALRFDIEGARARSRGRVRLENVSPEEFVVNRDARGLEHDTCRFVGKRVRTTESQLIAWGFDAEQVRRIPSAVGAFTTDQDYLVRSSQDDAQPFNAADRNDSERIVFVNDVFVKVDRDGDGISEWWHVVTGGEYAQMLLGAEPADGHTFVSGTPIPIPHRFYGLSLADVVIDREDVNTTLWRSVLDAAYLSNDPRNIVLATGGPGDTATPLVNIQQLNKSRPGGWIEEYAAGALRPYEHRSNIAELVPLIEFQRKEMQMRTGISPEAQGIDPQAISKHVYGAMVQQTAAQQRVVMFARIFAETLVVNFFKKIAKTLQQNVSKEYYIRLRGEWVAIDPSSWSNEYDCTIAVGLGHGSRMERANNLISIGEVQKQFAQAGMAHIVSDVELHNTASELSEALGFKDTVQFFKKPDPATNPAPPPEEDPAQQALALQQQIEVAKIELERQKIELDRFRVALEAKKAELDHEARIFELRMKGAQAAMDDPSFTVKGGAETEGGGEAPKPNGKTPSEPAEHGVQA